MVVAIRLFWFPWQMLLLFLFTSLHLSVSLSLTHSFSLSGLSSPCCLLFAVSVVRIVCSTINNNNELAMF